MDIATLVRQHAEGFYDTVFQNYRGSQSAMVGYVVHDNDETYPLGFNTNKLVTGACHASVNNAIVRDKALAVITMADASLAENEGALQFYDWLINKSFFSDVFLCKDPVLSLRHGFVKRVDVSAAKWLGAAQLSRLSTSEFKLYMHAVYDVLASGLEIHPLLMLMLATELNLTSDKKMILCNRPGRLNNISDLFYSHNSAHLPFIYAATAECLQELCKDDPTRGFTWVRDHDKLFTEMRWPNGSNQILSVKTNNGTQNDWTIAEAMSSFLRGSPSMLFNAATTVEANYNFIWEEAVEELKKFVYRSQPNAPTNGTPINLSGIETLSKQLKLGQ